MKPEEELMQQRIKNILRDLSKPLYTTCDSIKYKVRGR